jgi:hypothetical protein
MPQMDDFKTLVGSVRKKKGRMDASERQKGAELISAMLQDPEQDPTEMLTIAEDLQSEAVADGIGIVWPTLSAARRIQVRRWLPAPQTERAQRRIALLAARLATSDGATALELLDGLIPEHRPNKELKHLILTSLFSEKSVIPFDQLAKAAAAPRVSTKIFNALASLAFDPVSGVEPMARYLLSSAIVTFAVGQRRTHSSEGGDLLSTVAVEIERWPRELREQFERWLKNTHSDLLTQFFSGLVVVPQSSTQKIEGFQRDTAEAAQGSREQPQTVEQYLEQRVRSLRAELEVLSTVRSSLEESKNEQQRKMEGWKTRESELNRSIVELQSTCASLNDELSGTKRQIEQLRQDLQSVQNQKELEREKLTQQINANAQGRVSEFQNHVALMLSRHMVDLPRKDTVVSSELGRVLLMQFHQLIDVLRDLGIKLPKGRGVGQ